MAGPIETQPDQPPGGLPLRELRDPTVLRALSHPVRLRILEELAIHGPATATELSELTGESPANCSWHLRQLARYGFVEEAGGGTGRQRPWRAVMQGTRIPSRAADDPSEFATARDAMIEVHMGREVEAWRAWHASEPAEPPEWVAASFSTSSIAIWMTAEELATFRRQLLELVQRHVLAHTGRLDPDYRPADSRPIRFVAWAIPYGPPHPP